MNNTTTCDACGTMVDDTAKDGDCPTCLFRLAVVVGSDEICLATSAPTAEELGERLPDLDVIEIIGRGGMGAVYRARQKRLKREVAIKVLLEESASHVISAERFVREARALAQLHHQNIVTAFDAGEVDGLSYLVMQFVDGCDLRTLIAESGPAEPAQAIDWIIQSARGLEYAHRKGIVHRDIKPGNLLLDDDEIVRVLDLGLARFDGSDFDGQSGELRASEQHLTASGYVIGTADFMAPEQALDTRSADARSDVYSLGCTLYFMLTGRVMFEGETVMQKIVAHREQPRPSLAQDLPPEFAGLAGVCERMVARLPEDRFQNMTQVIDELEAIRRTAGQEMPASDQYSGGALCATAEFESDALLTLEADASDASGNIDNSDNSDLLKGELLVQSKTVAAPHYVHRLALVPTAVAAVCIAFAVIWVKTDHGTLVARIDEAVADEFEIRLRRDGLEIVDHHGNEAKRLRPDEDRVLGSGTWRLTPISGMNLTARNQTGVELNTDRFVIRRNDRVVVEVKAVRHVPNNERHAKTPLQEPTAYEVLTSAEWVWSRPENLGADFNSRADDNHPVLSADGLTIIFQSERRGGHGDRDLWISHRTDRQAPWSKPVNVDAPLNTLGVDHRPCLAMGDRTLVFQRGGPGFARRNGKLEWRESATTIWSASRESNDGAWSAPVHIMDGMAPVMSERGLSLFCTVDGQVVRLTRKTVESAWERAESKLPANSFVTWLSPDERIMLLSHATDAAETEPFALHLVTRRSIDEPWSEPSKLPAPIDDEYSQLSGTISADGRTLVFSSFRKGGVGAEDLWVCRRVQRTSE
ncbi:MAG: protein kinase [Planctomycetota bacterium]|nr:protein kinase [Planctomycetota bacterium]